MAEQFDDPNAAPEHPREEPVHVSEPEPVEPVRVDSNPTQPDQATEETEEEKELRDLLESRDHNRLVLTPEQAKRWQHALRLPDAAMPANDNESSEREG